MTAKSLFVSHRTMHRLRRHGRERLKHSPYLHSGPDLARRDSWYSRSTFSLCKPRPKSRLSKRKSFKNLLRGFKSDVTIGDSGTNQEQSRIASSFEHSPCSISIFPSVPDLTNTRDGFDKENAEEIRLLRYLEVPPKTQSSSYGSVHSSMSFNSQSSPTFGFISEMHENMIYDNGSDTSSLCLSQNIPQQTILQPPAPCAADRRRAPLVSITKSILNIWPKIPHTTKQTNEIPELTRIQQDYPIGAYRRQRRLNLRRKNLEEFQF